MGDGVSVSVRGESVSGAPVCSTWTCRCLDVEYVCVMTCVCVSVCGWDPVRRG